MKQNIINIIASPVIIALILTIGFLFFIPIDFDKFIVTLDKSGYEQEKNNITINCLKADNSESIWFKEKINGIGQLAYSMRDGNNESLGQVNFAGQPITSEKLYFGNIDNDDLLEVYGITKEGDKVWLNYDEPFDNVDKPSNKKLITRFIKTKGKYKFSGGGFHFYDLDNDGFKEVLFSINAGFALFPRKIYAYFPKTDSLAESPFCGGTIGISEIVDINNDGSPEILTVSGAPANIPKDKYPMHDQSSWLIVLDKNLQFLFDPIEFPGLYSNLKTFSFQTSGKNNLVVLFNNPNGEKEPLPKIAIYSIEGNLLNEKLLPRHKYDLFIDKSKTDDQLILFDRHYASVEFFDGELNKIGEKKIDIDKIRNVSRLDINDNGKDEWLFAEDDNQTFLIYCNDFSNPVSFRLTEPNADPINTYLLKSKDQPQKLFIQAGYNWYIYHYQLNPYYKFKYVAYPILYLFLLLITFVIQKAQKIRMQYRMNLEKQISELQLKTIRSQMDPHFTFNALNTISSIIYKEDKEKAHRYFTKFSKLVRATLEASDNIARTLREELDFTENYLLLEKIRFKDKFNYKIDLADNVNKDLLVPKMIIQIYVENAIKHGLKHKEKDGLLKIDISYNKRGRLLPGRLLPGRLLSGRSLPGRFLPLKIIIEDNGIGRKKAAELKTFGTGHGMKIMETIGKLYFKLYKIKISQKVEDLFDDKGNADGTRVVIEIPQKEE